MAPEKLSTDFGTNPNYTAPHPLITETYTTEELGRPVNMPLGQLIDKKIDAVQAGLSLTAEEQKVLEDIMRHLRMMYPPSPTPPTTTLDAYSPHEIGEEAWKRTETLLKEAGREKNPAQMKIEELVEELWGTINFKEIRAQKVMEEYYKKIDTVKDEKRKQYLKVKISTAVLNIAGDTGKDDFAIWEPAITETLKDRTITPITLARGLFLEKEDPTDPTPLTNEQLINLEKVRINLDLINMWDYMVERIKGKYSRDPRLASLPDRSDPTDDDFSYPALNDDRIAKFKVHVKSKFPDIDEDEFNVAFRLYQSTAVKTAGFVPWLARETTRGHGQTKGGDTSVKFEDVLTRRARFAFGFYSRGRYGYVTNSTAEDLLYMDEDVVRGVVNYDGKHQEKEDENIEFRNVIEDYRKALWGEIPQFVTDLREMIHPNGVLDIDENWFPMPLEMVMNLLRAEGEKRELLEDLGRNPHIPDTHPLVHRLHTLLEKWYVEGYDDKLLPNLKEKYRTLFPGRSEIGAFSDITVADYLTVINPATGETLLSSVVKNVGLKKLSQLTWDQYELADTKLDDFMNIFSRGAENLPKTSPKDDPKPSVHSNFVESWLSDVIGKTKLVPGKHQRLFGPYTVRMMHRLAHQYKFREDRAKVSELQGDFVKELSLADGVPIETRNYATDAVDPKKGFARSLFRAKRWEEGHVFKEAWFNYLQKHTTNPTIKIRRALIGKLPFDKGLVDEDGRPLQVIQPWDTKEVSKDTSKSK